MLIRSLRQKGTKITRIFIIFTIFLGISLFYCEYLHYFIVIYQCFWPNIKNNPENSETLHVIAVADTHLLGKRNGHWFDKLRREWQMYRAFQSVISLHKPELIIFLGDLFDEGKWCSKQEFKEYVFRFNNLFKVSADTPVLITAGNHDMGFHYSISPYLSSRFEEAFQTPPVYMKTFKNVTFIVINSMAMHGDDCFLCKPARLKVEAISKTLLCSQGLKENCAGIDKPPNNYLKPILVQHYPLYRVSDAQCNESDDAPQREKAVQFREKWECLSKESSYMLLRQLDPRLVLSGHTHHGCRLFHNFTMGPRMDIRNVLEYTVASFSWRNKKNPTFAMLTITHNDYAILKCHLPNENTVVSLYVLFGFIFLLFTLRRKFRLSNHVYSKWKRKL